MKDDDARGRVSRVLGEVADLAVIVADRLRCRHFVRAERNAKTEEIVKLPPGPNSHVGIMWLGLSKEHAGIHGTSEPSQMARVETNGCVRLTNWDVLWLSKITKPGVAVEVQA